jgi:hypothetical protein
LAIGCFYRVERGNKYLYYNHITSAAAADWEAVDSLVISVNQSLSREWLPWSRRKHPLSFIRDDSALWFAGINVSLHVLAENGWPIKAHVNLLAQKLAETTCHRGRGRGVIQPPRHVFTWKKVPHIM